MNGMNSRRDNISDNQKFSEYGFFQSNPNSETLPSSQKIYDEYAKLLPKLAEKNKYHPH